MDENEKYCEATELGDDLEQNEALCEEFETFMISLTDTGNSILIVFLNFLYALNILDFGELFSYLNLFEFSTNSD